MFPAKDHVPRIELDDDGRIFMQMVERYGRTVGIVDGYNNAMEGIKYMLLEKVFKFESSAGPWAVFFSNPNYVVPDTTPLRESENPKGSWLMDLFVDFNIIIGPDDRKEPNPKSKILIIPQVSLGGIPIMRGSKYDLFDDEEKQTKIGEDSFMPNGIFFVEGYFRTFNMFENLRVNQILCYTEKTGAPLSEVMASITTESRHGKTAQISLFIDKNVIKFSQFRGFVEEKKKPGNLTALSVFVILNFEKMSFKSDKDGVEGPMSIEDFILGFTRPEWRPKVRTMLSASLSDYYTKKNNPKELLQSIVKIKGDVNGTTMDRYEEQLRKDLYSHIGPEPENVKYKLALLSMQICKLIEVYLGLTPPHNRDSYSVKRLKNVGGSMYHLFGIFLELKMSDFVKSYNPYIEENTDAISNKIRDEKGSNNLTKSFITSFTKSWGLAGKTGMKNNIFTEILKIDSYMLAHFHVSKTVRGRDIHSKSYPVRAVQGTQVGKICISETPESSKCGLNNSITTCEYNSQHCNDDLIMSYIENYEKKRSEKLLALEGSKKKKSGVKSSKVDKSEENITLCGEGKLNFNIEGLEASDPILVSGLLFRDEIYDTLLIVNAVVKGVCNGKSMYNILIDAKRRRCIQKDICIILNEKDNYLYVNSDAGRPLSPLLVVEDGVPLIEKKGLLHEKDINKLMDAGVIEFVDSNEEEYKVVSFSRDNIKQINNKIKLINTKIEKLENILKNMESRNENSISYVRGIEDPEVFMTLEEREVQINAKMNDYTAKYIQYLDRYEELSNQLETLVDSEDQAMAAIENKKPTNAGSSTSGKLPNGKGTIGSYTDKYLAIIGDIKRLATEMNRYDPTAIQALSENKDRVNKQTVINQLQRWKIQREELRNQAQFDYCEIDPNAIFGASASVLKFANHNPGPRQTFGCKMAKQAKSLSSFSIKYKPYQTKFLTLPSVAIAETQYGDLIGLDTHPIGETVNVLVTSGGSLIEDGIVMSKGFVTRGGFQSVTTKIVSETFPIIRSFNTSDGSTIETVVTNVIPDEIKKKHPGAHRNLDERGVVIPGSVVRIGDCLLGRYRKETLSDGNVNYYDLSIYAKRSKVGIVEDVIYNSNNSENVMLKITLYQSHTPQVGDKFAPSHAQKGTVCKIVDDSELPVSITGKSKGMRPDIIIDIHAYPSRMTIGMILELVFSKAAVIDDKRVNATAMKRHNVEEYSSRLIDNGYGLDNLPGSFSKEIFINPNTGTPYEVPLAFGMCYYYSLVHESAPKLQNRFVGAYKRSTRQPVTGIDNNGGQRYGEMEFEALQAHGLSSMVQEFSTRNADLQILYGCKKCNSRVYRNHGKVYWCPVCKQPAQLIFAESTTTYAILNNYQEASGTRTKIAMIAV